VAAGRQRDDAYRIVQRLAQQAWDTRTPLRTLLEREPGVDLDLDDVFDYGYYTRHVPEVLARLEVIGPVGPADLRGARLVA
jgi:adenylosuccinate lyase